MARKIKKNLWCSAMFDRLLLCILLIVFFSYLFDVLEISTVLCRFKESILKSHNLLISSLCVWRFSDKKNWLIFFFGDIRHCVWKFAFFLSAWGSNDLFTSQKVCFYLNQSSKNTMHVTVMLYVKRTNIDAIQAIVS